MALDPGKGKKQSIGYIMKGENWIKLEYSLYPNKDQEEKDKVQPDKRTGIIYRFNKDRTDGFMYKASVGEEEGMAKFHIHCIEYWRDHPQDPEAGYMIFSDILPKSGNWRQENEPNLAQVELKDWLGLCNGMDSSTLDVVKALQKSFEELHAEGPQPIPEPKPYVFPKE